MDFSVDALPLVLGALLIFVARVCDVTLGTLRIAFISKGERSVAPFFAFFEMLIWLFAISQLARNIDNIFYYLAYAAGFASGVFAGLLIEEKIALGTRVVRTITKRDASDLVGALRLAGFGVTGIDATGSENPVQVIFSIVKRTDIKRYVAIVRQLNPNAFYTIEDVRFVSQGVFPARTSFFGGRWAHRSWGKTK